MAFESVLGAATSKRQDEQLGEVAVLVAVRGLRTAICLSDLSYDTIPVCFAPAAQPRMCPTPWQRPL